MFSFDADTDARVFSVSCQTVRTLEDLTILDARLYEAAKEHYAKVSAPLHPPTDLKLCVCGCVGVFARNMMGVEPSPSLSVYMCVFISWCVQAAVWCLA